MARLPRDAAIELTIAGRGPLEPVVRKAAAADPRVKFAGFVTGDAKLELLTNADYLLIPSLWYENAPIAVIEAAAYGLGVIGSRIGGIPELVDEGRTGFLFEPGDATALADLVLSLSGGELVLRDFATAARDVAERHMVSRMVDDYLAHYASLLRRKDVQHAA
jgi:glycosyltransferase involved in cell wall biosynthesis